MKYNSIYVTISMQVNHSQKLNEKPLTPWFVSLIDGKILSAHCDCMAGLGETCSHVASLLWVVAVGVEKRDSLTVTQKSAYWVMPPSIRSVSYARIQEIDFIGKKRKATHTEGIDSSSSTSQKQKCKIPTLEEKKKFLDSLACSKNAKPAVLSVLSGYCDNYIPSVLSSDLSPVLTDLYKPCNLSLSYFELLKLSNETVLTITDEQIKAVEMKTRDQSNSRLWFRMRAGRITASKFKAVCCTDLSSPSLSLILSICHPNTMRFRTAATSWGCQHEKDALEQYQKTSLHDEVNVYPSGYILVLHQMESFIALVADQEYVK